MEKEILDLITKLTYSERILELYNNRSENIEYPLKISMPPNYKVISDFADDYFNKYEYTLVENALINAILDNNQEYLKIFKKNIKVIKFQLEKDKAFRNKTTELAIKNISLKLLSNYNKDEEIKTKEKDLFETIKNIYTEIETIFYKFRKIILDFLNYTNKEEEIILDNILLTNYFDEELIKENNNILTKNNINKFKNILIRLIFFDNYLDIESSFIANENEENDEYDINIEKNILKYINYCIKNNIYTLPNNNELRLNIYSKFISYNLYFDSKEYDYETIKYDEKKILCLKKLNPLYKIDIYNIKK